MLLPIRVVTKPAVLSGQVNGRIDPVLLVSIPGLAGGPTVRLVEPAATGWRALTAAAQAAGHVLKATSAVDSYRPYDVQERTFLTRYSDEFIAGASTRRWMGRVWYLKPGYAPAAAPGTSNHGWALAVDTGEERDGDAQAESLDQATLQWLVDHELDYGFSHEIQEENWHIRWFVGDQIPPAVRAFTDGDGFMAALSDAQQKDFYRRMCNVDGMLWYGWTQGLEEIPAGQLRLGGGEGTPTTAPTPIECVKLLHYLVKRVDEIVIAGDGGLTEADLAVLRALPEQVAKEFSARLAA